MTTHFHPQRHENMVNSDDGNDDDDNDNTI